MTGRSPTSVWSSVPVDTLKLLLDPENPRIDVALGAPQDEIRNSLLEEAEVATLANEIVETGANFAGERIIVLKELPGSYLVLEGNRRACACQLLLDPSLLPAGHRKAFPTLPPALRAVIEKLEVDVAPNREAAEPIISRRHMASPVLRWSPLAQQRRIIKRISDGRTLDEIARELSMKERDVRSLAREHYLLQEARERGKWSRGEERTLADPMLKSNPFVRFFELKGAKKALGLTFKDDGKFETTLPRRSFDVLFASLARAFLIPDPKTGKPLANTRTEPAVLFGRLAKDNAEIGRILKATTGSSTAASLRSSKKSPLPRRITGKVDDFFESVTCSSEEHQLRQITAEISKIQFKEFPAAASFLLRAIMEGSLGYALKKKRLWSTFQKEWHANPKNSGRDPGLAFLIKYCIDNSSSIFLENEKRVLGKWLGAKNSWDLVVHLKTQAKWTELVTAAGAVRPLVVRIFDGSAFPP